MPFSILLGIGLAVAIPIVVGINTGAESTHRDVVVAVLTAVGVAAGASLSLIAVYKAVRETWSRRRRPIAWIAVLAIDAASRKANPSIIPIGIASRNDGLVIVLPRGGNDFITEGDSFLALQRSYQGTSRIG